MPAPHIKWRLAFACAGLLLACIAVTTLDQLATAHIAASLGR